MDNQKRRDIIDACVQEFAEYGYEKANTNRIAEEAGVSKGLIFHYFGSKQELFLLVVEECIGEIMHRLQGFTSESSDFIEASLACYEVKLRYYVENLKKYKLITQAFYNAPKELQQQLAERYKELFGVAMNMVGTLLETVPLRKEVTKESAVEIVTAIANRLEQKYIPKVIAAPDFSEELVTEIKEDYKRLMNIVMVGIKR